MVRKKNIGLWKVSFQHANSLKSSDKPRGRFILKLGGNILIELCGSTYKEWYHYKENCDNILISSSSSGKKYLLEAPDKRMS